MVILYREKGTTKRKVWMAIVPNRNLLQYHSVLLRDAHMTIMTAPSIRKSFLKHINLL